MTFMTTIVLFPSTSSPSAGDMNYAVAVIGGVLIIAVLYYYFPHYGGKYWFEGPLGALRRLEEEEDEKGKLEKEKTASGSDKGSGIGVE